MAAEGDVSDASYQIEQPPREETGTGATFVPAQEHGVSFFCYKVQLIMNNNKLHQSRFSSASSLIGSTASTCFSFSSV